MLACKSATRRVFGTVSGMSDIAQAGQKVWLRMRERRKRTTVTGKATKAFIGSGCRRKCRWRWTSDPSDCSSHDQSTGDGCLALWMRETSIVFDQLQIGDCQKRKKK